MMLKLSVLAALLGLVAASEYYGVQQYNYPQAPSYGGLGDYNVFRDLEDFDRHPEGDSDDRDFIGGYPYDYRQVFGTGSQYYPIYVYQRRPVGIFFRSGYELEDGFLREHGLYPVRDSNGQFQGYLARYPYSGQYEYPAEALPPQLHQYGLEVVADGRGLLRGFVMRNPENFYYSIRNPGAYGYQPYYGPQRYDRPQDYYNYYGPQGSNQQYPYGLQYYPNTYYPYSRNPARHIYSY